MDITSSLPLPTKASKKLKRFKELHHLQVQHVKQQLRDKRTLVVNTLKRNKTKRAR